MADNAAAISSIVTDVSNNAAALSSNDAEILSISNDVAGAIVDIADNKVMMQF